MTTIVTAACHPSSYVPEHALAPIKESVFLPYIFSHDEVRRLLAAATSHQGRFIWASMLRALILVLYCTGLRLGEAVRLRTADVDLNRGTLLIRQSKGRSRIVPIRVDLVAELCRYATERQRLLCDRRRSGRIEARIGLRMMPTFPRSPLYSVR
jgi:integrase/recombinase XerD